MSGPDGHEPDDGFQAEVSDLRSRAPVAGEPLSFHARRTRGRAIGWAIGLAVATLALLVAASLPNVRAGALALIAGKTSTQAATPSATTGPDSDLFYLLPNPPGVTASLDGRPLGTLPLPGGGHPLRLSAGHHQFRWTSSLYPLSTLTCQVSVPASGSDTCPFVLSEFIPFSLASEPGRIIAMHESLAALAAPEGNALISAIRHAVEGISSTALVQPGETFYYFDNNTLSGEPVVAQEPLQATLTFQYLAPNESGYPEPCILGQPAIPCRFPGQDCGVVCTVAQPPPLVTPHPATDWIAAVNVHASWTYTLLDGTPDAQNVAEHFGVQLMALRITRDAGGWHVTPIIGHTPGLAAADDPVCDPARYLLSQTNSWSFMIVNPPPYGRSVFVSSAALAEGCAVGLDFGPPTAPAIFLQRFGVLSTANDVARNPSDNLPIADAAERQVAEQLLASTGS